MKNNNRALGHRREHEAADAVAHSREGVLCVELCGEVDHHRAAMLREWMDELICRRQPRVMRLDLSGIEFMDSSGLGLLMGRYSLLSRQGGKLIVVKPSPPCRRMLDLAGMERILQIES